MLEVAVDEDSISNELPLHVVNAVKKSEEQIKNGQFYTYDEVKKLLAKR